MWIVQDGCTVIKFYWHSHYTHQPDLKVNFHIVNSFAVISVFGESRITMGVPLEGSQSCQMDMIHTLSRFARSFYGYKVWRTPLTGLGNSQQIGDLLSTQKSLDNNKRSFISIPFCVDWCRLCRENIFMYTSSCAAFWSPATFGVVRDWEVKRTQLDLCFFLISNVGSSPSPLDSCP